MNVAIVPARSGSKRIHKKNIKPFAGKPIIAYSILAANETGLFDRIIVSTDSDEIGEVAKFYGAEVPFTRPAELADDFAGDASVLNHALGWLAEHNTIPEYLCYIYATAPLIRSKYIKKGFDLLCEKNAATAFSVTTFPYPVFRALEIDNNGRLGMIWHKYDDIRSNDLPEAYHDAGQFYWGNAKKFKKGEGFLSSDAIPIILPRYLVQDIDTPEDWDTAERMYMGLQSNDGERNV